MLSRYSFLLSAACVLLWATSCNDGSKKSRGPIVIGDPATIVTETDSQYLQDMVLDYQPKPAAEAPKDTVAAPAPDTTARQVEASTENVKEQKEVAKAEPEKINGLKVDLGNATIVITGITAKGSGTSYQLKNGTLNGKQVKVTEGTVQKISQRYQTVVVADNNLGTLELDNLSTTSGWQTLKGSGSTYNISGLDDRNLGAPKVTPAAIKNAITRAARKHHISKHNEQKWLNSVKNVRNANQDPLSVELRSVMWKIDGKDAKGKSFTKQVRIDLPL